MHHSNSVPSVYEVIFILLRRSLLGQQILLPSPDTINWDEVWKELQQQAIHLPVTEELIKEDPLNQNKYLQSAYHGAIKYHRLMQEQQRICAAFHERGIPCVILKGAAANQYYPKADIRSMGDIDILVNPEDYANAKELLCGNGKFLQENFRHCTVRTNGVVVELHHCFSTFKNLKHRQSMDNRLFRALPHVITATQDNYSFPTLPTLENGLVLLAHICQHMELGLGLRQFVDWMMFVESHLDDAYWNNEFGPAVRQLGLETFAVTVTRMCQIYLGTRKDITWCASAPDDLCEELMLRTIAQGNFGRKLPARFNTAVSILRLRKNIPALFSTLQRYGCMTWPLLKRFPILKPFAWLYQICKYIRLGFQKKHPIRFLLSALRNEGGDSTLLERAGVLHSEEDK